ncbi:MAG: hypothetical protein KC422_04480 [Trueperaceae bacterium]|nr:hypothetical protein [Trueperaceae bacterium]
MALSSLQIGKTQPTRQSLATKPLSTLAFDWVYTTLLLLLSAGIYMDGWSHIEYGPDQSVFSEYHLLFYSSLAVIGLWLIGHAYRYLRQGYNGLNALPAGYLVSFFGVLIFGIGGVLDLTGHSFFGFEADMEALLSPTHMMLFIGWAMIAVGPARAASVRRRREGKEPGLLSFLPALISWTMVANVFAFAGMAYFPTVNNAWMLADWRTTVEWYGHSLGVMGTMAQSVLMVGTALWLVHSFKLPGGSFTFFFSLFALLMTITSFIPEFIPVFIATGILMDVLYVLLKPSSKRPAQLYSFGFALPLVFWSLFYTLAIQTGLKGGVWYTGYIWMGSIFEAAIVGLLIALLSNYSSQAEV